MVELEDGLGAGDKVEIVHKRKDREGKMKEITITRCLKERNADRNAVLDTEKRIDVERGNRRVRHRVFLEGEPVHDHYKPM